MIVQTAKRHVADALNHRVLIWDKIPTTTAAPATVVIGQANFTNSAINAGTGIGNGVFNIPNGIDVSDSHMVVADRGNNRVLIWNGVPTTDMAMADLVIGQADFTGSLANRGGAVAANTLNGPMDVRICDDTLYVTDRLNSRILGWNNMPSQNGQPADFVIGQLDFMGGTANRGGAVDMDTLNEPYSLFCDANRIYIADGKNFRVIIKSR